MQVACGRLVDYEGEDLMGEQGSLVLQAACGRLMGYEGEV